MFNEATPWDIGQSFTPEQNALNLLGAAFAGGGSGLALNAMANLARTRGLPDLAEELEGTEPSLELLCKAMAALGMELHFQPKTN
jgi:DNA-binding phage protein